MNDLLVTAATVVDGTGSPARTADVAIRDGVITEVGGLDGRPHKLGSSARQTIDAHGCLLAPAWVDIHTHFDGQATWDDAMDPSASHGVGTVVMGNCGVGFAPVPAGGERRLIELMEGVEDIPGTVLYEGMPWGQWHTFPEYLDFLQQRRYALDIGAMITHGAVRNAVMGERGGRDEAANADELRTMQQIVAEALSVGAMGFSTSRIRGHRSVRGEPVPGTFAAADEVMCFAKALGEQRRGVYQIIPSSTLGSAPHLGGERHSQLDELELMGRASIDSGRPVTFTLFQADEWPDLWRQVLERVVELNAQGAQLHPQVGARAPALVMSLATYHPFMRRPTYLKIRELPLARRLERMREPQVKAAILAEASVPHELPGTMENAVAFAQPNHAQTFALADAADHEPCAESSFAARARALGVDSFSLLYDYLVGGEGDQAGRRFVLRLFANYSRFSYDAVREMQLHPATVTGLGDAGAHVSVIFDAVAPTYQLTHWVRDRSRGARLPLESVVHKQTLKNARLFGLRDRGAIAPGLRADFNLIDFDQLALGELVVHRDLPAGGIRLLQPASGYVATFVHGVRTRDHDRDTGARPGRLVRSTASI